MKYLVLLLAFVFPLHAQPTLANSDDITAAKARANHTGTQLMSTISDAGTAATTNATAYATSAQGVLADNSVQQFDPSDLSPVAWWDASDSARILKTISGSVVATTEETVERWTDKIGGLNLDQVTAGQRWTLTAGGILTPNNTGGCSMTTSIVMDHRNMSLVFVFAPRSTSFHTTGYLWWKTGFTTGCKMDRLGGEIYGPTTTGAIGAYDANGSLLAFCFGASTSSIYNGYKTVSLAARTAGSSTVDRFFDYDVNAVPFRWPVKHVLYFNRQLTSAEVDQLRTWSDMPVKDTVLSTFGDSIAAGETPSSQPYSFIKQLCTARGWTLAHGSVNGGTTTAILATSASVINASYTAGKTNRLILHVGSNDLAANMSSATFLANLATFYTARKALSTDWDVAVCTVPPRNQTFTGTDAAGYAAVRATVNAALQAAAPGTYFDRLIDFESDAILGPDATADNTTWFNADKIHPHQNGHNRMAVIAGREYP